MTEFIIKRSSGWGKETVKCDEAVLKTIPWSDGGSSEEWTLKITTLKQLQEFIHKYGSIVIEKWHYDESRQVLEIYDGWRE